MKISLFLSTHSHILFYVCIRSIFILYYHHCTVYTPTGRKTGKPDIDRISIIQKPSHTLDKQRCDESKLDLRKKTFEFTLQRGPRVGKLNCFAFSSVNRMLCQISTYSSFNVDKISGIWTIFFEIQFISDPNTIYTVSIQLYATLLKILQDQSF